jgi:DNA repair protein SbcD/Mre11
MVMSLQVSWLFFKDSSAAAKLLARRTCCAFYIRPTGILGNRFMVLTATWNMGFFSIDLWALLKSGARDALIIAGDIFDSVNPPAGAQRRFFDFLARAHAAVPGLQVIVIAGNHDAGARLEAPAGLFESMNIKAVGTIARDTAGEVQYDKILVPLKDANGCVRAIVLAVPFLRPADVPAVPESSDSYLTGIREFYRRATEAAVSFRDSQYPGAILIALGHCHLADAVESRESERRIVSAGRWSGSNEAAHHRTSARG